MRITHRNNDLSDRELLDKYKASGDLSHLGQLYNRYMHLVYGVCLKYLKDRDQSQDAVMEIFEQLVTKLREHEVDRFKSWLYVTSRNYCLMQLRKSKPEIRIEEYMIPDMESDEQMHPDSEDGLEKDLQKLEACIEGLGEEQKECVRLFFLKKNSYAEIVDKTGHPLKKVKSFIQNGKRNLKICMEANGGKK